MGKIYTFVSFRAKYKYIVRTQQQKMEKNYALEIINHSY